MQYHQVGQNFFIKPGGGQLQYSAYIKPVCLPCSRESCVHPLLQSDVQGYKLMSAHEKCRAEGEQIGYASWFCSVISNIVRLSKLK